MCRAGKTTPIKVEHGSIGWYNITHSMKKDNDRRELTGKVVLSDQVATQFLTEKEGVALDTGSAFCDQFLEDMRNPITGELPDGAEDLAVEKAEAVVPGYGTALEKWANGFRRVLTSGKG